MAKKVNSGEKVQEVAWNWVGIVAFLLGIVISLVSAIWQPYDPLISTLLFALGIIVGLLNITVKEINSFLLAAVALILTAFTMQRALTTILYVGTLIPKIADNLTMFIGPAALIVALKVIWEVARSK